MGVRGLARDGFEFSSALVKRVQMMSVIIVCMKKSLWWRGEVAEASRNAVYLTIKNVIV